MRFEIALFLVAALEHIVGDEQRVFWILTLSYNKPLGGRCHVNPARKVVDQQRHRYEADFAAVIAETCLPGSLCLSHSLRLGHLPPGSEACSHLLPIGCCTEEVAPGAEVW